MGEQVELRVVEGWDPNSEVYREPTVEELIEALIQRGAEREQLFDGPIVYVRVDLSKEVSDG